MCACVCVCLCMCMCKCVVVRVWLCVYSCAGGLVHVCVCVCVCVCGGCRLCVCEFVCVSVCASVVCGQVGECMHACLHECRSSQAAHDLELKPRISSIRLCMLFGLCHESVLESLFEAIPWHFCKGRFPAGHHQGVKGNASTTSRHDLRTLEFCLESSCSRPYSQQVVEVRPIVADGGEDEVLDDGLWFW